jgi:hypothetical protein
MRDESINLKGQKMKFWNNTHPRNEESNTAYGELVPAMGKCETLEGELLRASSKIYYDFFNNGFGNNWSGPLNYLDKHMSLDKQTYDGLVFYSRGRIYDGEVEESKMHDLLDNLVCSVLDIIAKGERRPNPNDMYDEEEAPYCGDVDDEY